MLIQFQLKKVFTLSFWGTLSLAITATAQEFNYASYIGGAKDEYIEEVAVDHHGNIILAGGTASDGMATPGAYQVTKSNGNDFFVSKFRSNGTLVWTTYYGGDKDDFALAICIDLSDNIYVGGRTKSGGLASPGAYKTSKTGDYDALLVKFDSTGNRQWATYFGGSSLDQVHSCVTDAQGNIYIGGYTESITKIATANAHQETYGGGNGDGFLTKFNSSGAIQWATYYGGNLQDRVHCVVIDHNGDLIVSGTTPSPKGIATSGTLQLKVGGDLDAFLVKFTSNGSRVWGTYFGKKGTERGRACCVDDLNNIYLNGYTSSDSLLATPGAYQYYLTKGFDTDSLPTSDAFLIKFSPQGKRIWSTYYGGTKTEWAHGITWHDGLIAISGLSSSTTMIATNDALQPEMAGSQDVYLAVFSDAGSLVWSTYYGGTKGETFGSTYGPDAEFTAEGDLVLTFSTHSAELPSSNSFHLPTNKTDGMLVYLTTDFFQKLHQNQFIDYDQPLLLYPNPATDQCMIVMYTDKNFTAQLLVRNLSGNILLTKMISLVEGRNNFTMDLSSFSKGFYISEIILSDGRKKTRPFAID